jgi:hypothetical protein
MNIADEFRAIAGAALAGDPLLSTLRVSGTDADCLSWSITPGPLPRKIGGVEWSPAAPFTREIVVDLIGRMMRKRWSRYDAYTLSVVPATQSDLDDLPKKYAACRYAGVGPGWADLLNSMFEGVAAAGHTDGWQTSDIKEKFATLRVYHGGQVGGIGRQIIDAAEHVSGFICDMCGAPGKLRGSGWYVTRCDDHEGAAW